MIRVGIRATADGRTRCLEVQGHAGLDTAGKDVLCAAVSVLAENLAASLRELLKIPVVTKVESGNFRLELTEADLSYETDLLFASVTLGFKSIAGSYPERVEVTETLS